MNQLGKGMIAGVRRGKQIAADEAAANEIPAAETPAPVVEKPKEPLVAPASALTLAEQHNQAWRLVAKDATRDDLLSPGFWSVVQSKLRSFDRIAIITATTYYDVLCLFSEPSRPVQMEILREVDIPIVAPKAEQKLPAGFVIEYNAAAQTYQAKREGDGAPMGAPCLTWLDAHRELVNHAIFRK